MPELDIVSLPACITVADARTEVTRQIADVCPKCLVVDTFPRGLVGDLVDTLVAFPGRKVLVQRDLNPEYVDAYDLTTFTHHSYDLIIDSGDTGTADPWLVRSAAELPATGNARERLGISGDKPCVLVLAAGNPEEMAWYGAVAARLHRTGTIHVRCIAPECPPGCPPACWRSYWPAIDLLPAADVVVGGGGYNTVYECLACDVPLIARSWPRKYDRQRLRAERVSSHGNVAIVESHDEAVAETMRRIESGFPLRNSQQFRNGAEAAAQLIAELLASNGRI